VGPAIKYKRPKIGKYSVKGCGPVEGKSYNVGLIMLCLAHIADHCCEKKLIYAEIIGLGPYKPPKWTGLNLDYDHFVSSQFCHVGLAT
jgi:hypothetical protein